MNRPQYQASALLTCSDGFNLKTEYDAFEAETGAPTVADLYHVMKGVIDAARWLENLKRSMYYGKDYVPPLKLLPSDASLFMVEEINEEHLPDGVPTIQMLHAAVGIATEAGELLETIFFSMFAGVPLDHTNLIEELGDGEWYAAVMRDQLHVTQQEVQRGNIAKLKSRYPERKWEEASAIHRDVAAERSAIAEEQAMHDARFNKRT